MEQLEFYGFKQKLLEGKKLFKDRDFPPNDASFSQTSKVPVPYNMKWMRASEISKNPKFFVGGATRFDVNQGSLGDCWFLAGMASLAMRKDLFAKVVPMDQS